MPPPPSEDTAQRLREVALQLFADRGYAATSMRQIASEAGVSPGVLTYHYPRKELLLQAAVAEPYERLVSDLRAIADEPGRPVAQRLRAFVERLSRLTPRDIVTVRALLIVVLTEPDKLGPIIPLAFQEGHAALLVRLLAEARAGGVLPEGTGTALMPAILGSTVLAATMLSHAGPYAPDQALVARVRENATEELLALLGV